MASDKIRRFWTLVTVFLAAVIVIGGLVVWLRYHPNQSIEISLPESQGLSEESTSVVRSLILAFIPSPVAIASRL